MTLSRSALALLALALLGPPLLVAQEQPLAAGADGVPVPKKKKHVQPVYPQDALAQGIRGIVILELVIDAEGRVAETNIIRSIPGLDEAALAAVTQWVYDPVEIDGEPVSVRLTVPITFALKLPQMSRQPGIPPLRQGVTPPWPDEGVSGGRAVADVTLEPDGRIGLARILEGEEPWSTALLEALRTWRFSAPPDDVMVSFQVAAEFVPGRGRDDKGTVRLDLRSLREAAILDAGEEEPVATAELTPAPAAETPTPDAPPAPPRAASDPGPASGPEPGAGEGPAAAPAPPAIPAPETGASTATPPAAPGDGEPPASPAVPTGLALARPASGASPPEAGTPMAAAPPPAMDPTAPPPIETLSVAPPPLPPENGISAIRGVQLEPGVPDLTQGRRPVSPPLARMEGAGGVVEVDFSVSAGGVTTVQRTDGPEVLRLAATSAVESWVFRRTRADRAYLTAVFTYEDDLASAVVRPQSAR